MKLCFDSIAEVREFVAGLKGTRGGKKGEGDDTTDTAASALNVGGAPAPMMPPQQGGAMPSFQSQQPNFAPPQPQQPAFPGAGGVGIDPNVTAIVQRINARIDGAINNGQPADTVLGWFRGECTKGGVDATNATLDQIKQTLLPRLPMQHLEAIAKLMNA